MQAAPRGALAQSSFDAQVVVVSSTTSSGCVSPVVVSEDLPPLSSQRVMKPRVSSTTENKSHRRMSFLALGDW